MHETARGVSRRVVRIPDAILSSPLMKKGGFEVVEGMPDQRTFKRMQSEALRLWPHASESYVALSESGGIPARRQLRALSRHVQRSFYHRRATLTFLREVSGLPVVPTGAFGGYLYYTRPGDHLDVHRDGDGCDLTLITCLVDRASPASDDGDLSLYPHRLFERIEAIRARPEQGAIKIRLPPGQTLVIFGGFVAHSVRPVSERRTRIVSALCYRVNL